MSKKNRGGRKVEKKQEKKKGEMREKMAGERGMTYWMFDVLSYFLIEVYLIYNVELISVVQQSDSLMWCAWSLSRI